MRTNLRAGSKEGIIHHVKGYLSYSTVWPFSWHLEIYSIAHMWRVLHLSTVFVSINLNVFTPVTLCSEPEQGNWWSHLAFRRLALPPQSEGGGCWDPRGWAKGKSVSFTTQSSPRSLLDLTTMIRSFETPQTEQCQPYFLTFLLNTKKGVTREICLQQGKLKYDLLNGAAQLIKYYSLFILSFSPSRTLIWHLDLGIRKYTFGVSVIFEIYKIMYQKIPSSAMQCIPHWCVILMEKETFS